jgi:hypothetical protein
VTSARAESTATSRYLLRVRTESAIVVQATENVGPTRLRLQTAASAKLPVVVRELRDDVAEYHVFTVASLQAALIDRAAAHALVDALGLADRTPAPPVSAGDAAGAPVGTPVVDNGRVVGVRAPDAVELSEITEAEMMAAGSQARSETRSGEAASDDGRAERKRGLWQRITRSGD